MDETLRSLPALADGGAAVITGGASGIGLAAARRFSALGLPVVLADLSGDLLRSAEEELRGAGRRVAAVPTDVSRPVDLERLRDTTLAEFGCVSILMLNAGMGIQTGGTWRGLGAWKSTMDVNFWGVVHGAQAFLPAMAESGRPGLVIATGSKQGITTPPGNAAYNVSKAALKAYLEAVAHELRNTEGRAVSAHLLIPGFTFTGMLAERLAQKPPSAWTAEQVVEFMLETLVRGDFYILCPDNDVTREVDAKRIAWAAGDIIENRPALSRWHPDWSGRFAAYMAQP